MTDDKKLTAAESNGRPTPGDALVKPDGTLHVTKADWLNYKPDGPLDHLVDRAVTIPSATIHKHVDKVRARNPGASPAEIIKLLEKEYMRVIQTTGSAVGERRAVDERRGDVLRVVGGVLARHRGRARDRRAGRPAPAGAPARHRAR